MGAAISRYIRGALADTDLGPSAAHLLEVLGNIANRDGLAWPSIDTLAARMRASRSTVKRARAELVDAGVIAVDTGGGTVPNRYRFPVASALDVIHTRSTDDPGTRFKSATHPGHGWTYPGSPMTPEVSKKGPKKALCAPDCPDCDGTGYVAVPDPRGGTAAAPCPRRATA